MIPNIERFCTSWQQYTWNKQPDSVQPNSISACISDHGFTDSIVASTYTVKDIIEKYPPPYILCCTGGIDSQAMIYAWGFATDWDSKLFSVVSFLYDEHCNQYDMVGLQELCDEHGISRTCKDFPLMDFMLSGECTDYQIKYHTQSPQMAAHIKMIETFEKGTVLMSGELLNPGHESSITVNHFSVVKYALDFNNTHTHKKIIPFFFEHTDVIGTAHWHTFTKEKSKQYHKLLVNKYDINTNDPTDEDRERRAQIAKYELKNYKYTECGYPVKPQQQGGGSGFETFKHLYEKVAKIHWSDKLKYSPSRTGRGESFWKYDILHRYKIREKVHYKDFWVSGDYFKN